LCTPIARGSAESLHIDDDPVHTVSAMRVVIDADKCQGHNRCYAIAPELFDVDEYGQSVVLGDGTVPPELVEKARLAVANCPEYAISVIEEDTRP
jgi:ferredoxin